MPSLAAWIVVQRGVESRARARQADGGEAAGEAEAVQEAEGEGDDPGMADGEARLAAPRADDFRSEEQDRERCGEGDAVRDGEGADGFDEHPPAFHDEQEAEHEQEVIGTE